MFSANQKPPLALAFHVQSTILVVFGGTYIIYIIHPYFLKEITSVNWPTINSLPCGWWLAWFAKPSPEVIGDGILKFMQLKVLRAGNCVQFRSGGGGCFLLVGKLVNNEYAIIDGNLQDEVIIGGEKHSLLTGFSWLWFGRKGWLTVAHWFYVNLPVLLVLFTRETLHMVCPAKLKQQDLTPKGSSARERPWKYREIQVISEF